MWSYHERRLVILYFRIDEQGESCEAYITNERYHAANAQCRGLGLSKDSVASGGTNHDA